MTEPDVSTQPIRGILPALLTPLDENGNVDRGVLAELVGWLVERGVHGLYVCGSTGEGLVLREEERERVAETAVEAVEGRATVMIHVGAVATDQAVRLARHAESIGADAISSVPPPVFGRSAAGIRAHYAALCENCSLPLYLYNIPSLIPVAMTADVVRPLLDLPTVRGIKTSDPDLFAQTRLTALPGCDVLHGCDELLLYGFMSGAVGGIGSTYNLMPRTFVELYRLAQAGEWEAARLLQLRITQMVTLMLDVAGPALLSLLKRLMSERGFECGEVIAPSVSADVAMVARFHEAVRQAELDDLLADAPRVTAEAALRDE